LWYDDSDLQGFIAVAENAPIAVGELTSVREPEATDSGYLAWKKAKIEAALRQANARPDDVLTEQEVWQKHGLEY